MTIMMPAPDQAVLERRDVIVAALRAIVPGEGVIDSSAEMTPYESDGLMAFASRRWWWCCRTPQRRCRRC